MTQPNLADQWVVRDPDGQVRFAERGTPGAVLYRDLAPVMVRSDKRQVVRHIHVDKEGYLLAIARMLRDGMSLANIRAELGLTTSMVTDVQIEAAAKAWLPELERRIALPQGHPQWEPAESVIDVPEHMAPDTVESVRLRAALAAEEQEDEHG